MFKAYEGTTTIYLLKWQLIDVVHFQRRIYYYSGVKDISVYNPNNINNYNNEHSMALATIAKYESQ